MRIFLPGLALLLCTSTSLLADPAQQGLEEQARALSMSFIGQLKPQLQEAMQRGGPTHAIEICASEAPRIAASLSAESGWQVRRVSLRSRNASRAVPDQWERKVLQQFDARQTAGEAAANIAFGETIDGQYRYMQAQGVAPVCLTCHGESLPEPVRLTLQEYYPDDQATGYSLGQVRGAISLTKVPAAAAP